MLNKIKNHILPMLDTLNEALNETYLMDRNAAKNFTSEIVEFLNAINTALGEESDAATSHGIRLQELLLNYGDAAQEQVMKEFDLYCTAIKRIPTQYKAVFLPYYDNTWDSLKSVYEAFEADPMFTTEIVIIPIIRNTPTGFVDVYDDYLTPQGIPNTHYLAYDFEIDQPDFVFYNNPYDGVNYPKFQSQNIKPHAGHMVYIPYFLHNHMSLTPEMFKQDMETCTELEGHNNADIFIAQGKEFKNSFQSSKNANKMIAVGSPKIDNILRKRHAGNWTKYPEWEEAIHSKCTFFLNTHYRMVSMKYPLHSAVFDYIFNFVKNNDDLALIWRPHPQTFLMLGQENELTKEFREYMDMAEGCKRIILDRSGSVVSALMYSDAIISPLSSILAESLVLDKPIFCNTPDYRNEIMNADEENLCLTDAVHHWGLLKDLPEDIDLRKQRAIAYLENFITEVCNGIDSKKELREKFCKQQFSNLNGTCGESILEYIKQKIQEEAL